MGFSQAGAEIGAGTGALSALGIMSLTGIGKSKGAGSSRARTAKQIGNTFVGSTGGGLTLSFDQNEMMKSGIGLKVESSAERQGLVNNLSNTFGLAGQNIGALRGDLDRGFGLVGQARRNAINTSRDRAMSDMRDELGRRRILGSSFASDTMARAEAEYGQQMAAADAQSFLDELGAEVDLIDRETKYNAQSFQAKLDELNIQASVLQPMIASVNQQTAAMGEFAMKQAYDYAQQQAGLLTYGMTTMGSGFGRAGGAVGDAYSGNIGGMMGGGGGSTAPQYNAPRTTTQNGWTYTR